MLIIITVFNIFGFLETFLEELRLKNAYHYYCVQNFLFIFILFYFLNLSQ